MNDRSEDLPDVAALLSSQKAYYDLRAADYLDVSRPDRRETGAMAAPLIEAVVDQIDPTGHTLELACGTGVFTRELVRPVPSLTAVDARVFYAETVALATVSA
jgi:hypothetical protein